MNTPLGSLLTGPRPGGPDDAHPGAPTERIDAGELAGRSVDPRHQTGSPVPGERNAGQPPHTGSRAGPPAGPVPDVTVVLPCDNEAAHVLAEVDRIGAALDASEFAYEMLVIDDASTDDTLAVRRAALTDDRHLRVLPFRRNGGSGTVHRIGIQRARGEIVGSTDADMTHENDRIPEPVRILRDDPSSDQVVGLRTREEGTHTWAHVPAGSSCGTTLTIAFRPNQHDILHVETASAKRAGVSTFHVLHHASRHILQVMRVVTYVDPLRVLMPVALWLLVVGFGKAIVDLVRYQSLSLANNPVLLVVTGVMIATLALLADLVVRSRHGV